MVDPEENDPLYRAYAFPVQAPSRGASRPQRVVRETVLSSNREGRRGRAYAKQVGPHEDIFDDEPLELPVQPPREETMMNVEEVDHMVAQLPIEAELDEGYVFGRDNCSMVLLSIVQKASSHLTNQQVINTKLSVYIYIYIYSILASKAYKDMSPMTLRPISCQDTSGGVKDAEKIMFDGIGGQTLFMDTVTAWMVKHGFNPKEVSIVECANDFMRDVIWKPVNGQHVYHACTVIAPTLVETDDITLDFYEKRFLRRPAITVIYNSPSFYVHKSRRLNAHHFAHQKVATIGESIRKMRDMWGFYGCPIVESAYAEQRATFLGCLPSILSVPTVPLQGPVSITDILRGFQDYLPHVTQEDHENVEAILKVCNDYAECKTFYFEADEKRWLEYEKKKLIVPSTKKPTRKKMAISWFKPLKGLSTNDYKLLCSRASIACWAQRQQIFFEGYARVEPLTSRMQDNAHRLKQRYAIRNALKYLSIRSNITSFSWRVFGVPFELGVSSRTNSEILLPPMLFRIYEEMAATNWQSAIAHAAMGGADYFSD